MGLQGYVGNADDQRRIRRQEKEREEKKAQYEKSKAQSDANVDAAGLRVFGAGTSEARALATTCMRVCCAVLGMPESSRQHC
jgi:hypothetical protein